MATAKLEIPADRIADIEKYKDRLSEVLLLGLTQMKIQESLYLYKRGLTSFRRAAELAGLAQEEMMRQARAHGIEPRWSEHMVEEELA
ncbi:putative toxin-antitoxin system, antitoxin component [delta proteobacterium NaphS2]|nr:putative toxin-antitoxin system, antitoxin component [delta proteobacterium NaphS2]